MMNMCESSGREWWRDDSTARRLRWWPGGDFSFAKPNDLHMRTKIRKEKKRRKSHKLVKMTCCNRYKLNIKWLLLFFIFISEIEHLCAWHFVSDLRRLSLMFISFALSAFCLIFFFAALLLSLPNHFRNFNKNWWNAHTMCDSDIKLWPKRSTILSILNCENVLLKRT